LVSARHPFAGQSMEVDEDDEVWIMDHAEGKDAGVMYSGDISGSNRSEREK